MNGRMRCKDIKFLLSGKFRAEVFVIREVATGRLLEENDRSFQSQLRKVGVSIYDLDDNLTTYWQNNCQVI